MRKTLLIIAFLGAANLFAQEQPNTELIETIKNLQTQINQQQSDIQKLYSELNKEYRTYRIVKEDLNQTIIDNQVKVVDSLNTLISKSKQELSFINKQLNTKIQKADENANSKISELDSSLGKSRLYWIIATLATLLLGGLVYWLLGKRIQSSKTDVETQIKNTKTALEEESVKLDNKLVDVLETQLKLKQEETKVQPTTSNEKADHSLALKVADEVIRIQKNLSRMDDKTKGLKQLNSSVKRIQDNFTSNGYELVDMLGKEYNEGMKVTANFTPSEDLETGKQIISRIIKPQVNFKGEMIQAAQIEVSVGE
ncbi:hypothetical protein [uncultured Nonlabens sp.]|uniref:hypothetical protein n=1 Tax=uncultured Nonlabens sp. TaxID=859306 RepID=UPI0026143089|nr:hypothetical protein [uncultured Nonlabens sp.]